MHATRSDQFVFTGFNSRVAALDRRSGQIAWDWRSPKGSGYVTLLLDDDLLLVAVNGYQYALDPVTGDELWANSMSGFGYGVSSLATTRGSSSGMLQQAAAEDAARNASTAS